MQFLTIKYLEFSFFYSLERIIIAPTGTTDRTAKLTDHVLTNPSHKASHSGEIDLVFPIITSYFADATHYDQNCINIAQILF